MEHLRGKTEVSRGFERKHNGKENLEKLGLHGTQY
jgi:hypothetical protein